LDTIELLQRDSEALHSIGIYQYMHPLQNAVAYQTALAEIRGEIKKYGLGGSAIEASTRFSFDNSLAKGRKMTADLAGVKLGHHVVDRLLGQLGQIPLGEVVRHVVNDVHEVECSALLMMWNRVFPYRLAVEPGMTQASIR
jgi:hypothetical protein